jgi:hypothetical protein
MASIPRRAKGTPSVGMTNLKTYDNKTSSKTRTPTLNPEVPQSLLNEAQFIRGLGLFYTRTQGRIWNTAVFGTSSSGLSWERQAPAWLFKTM